MRKRRYLHLLLLLFTFVLPAATAFAQDGNQQDVIDKIISFLPCNVFLQLLSNCLPTSQEQSRGHCVLRSEMIVSFLLHRIVIVQDMPPLHSALHNRASAVEESFPATSPTTIVAEV